MNTVNAHEIILSMAEFERFTNNSYVILKQDEIEVNDYILFKREVTVDNGEGGTVKTTDLYRMTQVKDLATNAGLKEGYVVVTVTKL